MFNKEETLKYLLNGSETIDEQMLEDKIDEVYNEGRVLRIKFGMDPSAPDLHLGHAVALRKIKQLQDLGHKAVIIIGDFTGMIGDPTGKSKTRNQLTKKQVEENAQTYFNQLFRIIDKDKIELRYNSEWYDKISFRELIDLCSNTTVSQILTRDDFENRFKNHKPISLHELFYPLMQAYDSVVVKADIEFGGTDQMFNVLMGREIQKDYNISPQVPIFVPLLEGIDGKEKMSKSLGNYIGIDEPAKEKYVKIMQIPDELIIRYFNLTTDLHPDKIEKIKEILESNEINPRDIKMKLAREIIGLYHNEEELKEAEDNFRAIYQKKDIDIELPIIEITKEMFTENGELSIIECLFTTGKYKSKSEIRRLIQQNAIKINGERINRLTVEYNDDIIIQVGKGNLFKLQCNMEKEYSRVRKN